MCVGMRGQSRPTRCVCVFMCGDVCVCRYERLKTSHGQPDVCVCLCVVVCVCLCVVVCVCVGMRGLRPVTANQMCVCECLCVVVCVCV